MSKKIIFPELENDERIAQAVEYIERESLATIIRTKEIPHDPETITKHCAALPKWKTIGEREKDAMIADPLIWALLALREGTVDSVIAGAHMTTADVLRGAIRVIGTRKGITSLSSCFMLQREEDKFIFADCAVNIDPSAQTLADTAKSCIEIAHKIGITPRVAFLSFATGDTASADTAQKVARATKIFQEANPDIASDGPLQFDAAYDTQTYAQKSESEVFKDQSANIFIFPNLDSGNISYKVARELGGFSATGPILLGTDKEVHDLSRGCSVDDIINLVRFSTESAK